MHAHLRPATFNEQVIIGLLKVHAQLFHAVWVCTVNIDVGASLACNRYIKHSKSVRSVVCNVLQLTQIDAPATLYTLDLFSMIYKEDRGEEEEKKKTKRSKSLHTLFMFIHYSVSGHL